MEGKVFPFTSVFAGPYIFALSICTVLVDEVSRSSDYLFIFIYFFWGGGGFYNSCFCRIFIFGAFKSLFDGSSLQLQHMTHVCFHNSSFDFCNYYYFV